MLGRTLLIHLSLMVNLEVWNIRDLNESRKHNEVMGFIGMFSL